MLEIDYRNVSALSFMGVTHHLLGNVETAIVKYHEVSNITRLHVRRNLTCGAPQALSIEPINGYVLELLDLALETSADMGPFGLKGPPGGEENWAEKMREHRDKGKQVAKNTPFSDGDQDTSL